MMTFQPELNTLDHSKNAERSLRLSEFVPYQLAVVGNLVSHAIAALYEKKYNIQIPEWRILMTLAELSQIEVRCVYY